MDTSGDLCMGNTHLIGRKRGGLGLSVCLYVCLFDFLSFFRPPSLSLLFWNPKNAKASYHVAS